MKQYLKDLSSQVVEMGTRLGLTVGTAESLTGGMIASCLASVPGASKVLRGGIVSYDPAVKNKLLGVPQEIIDTVGVVSDPCARQMAQGAQASLEVAVAVSATGLAGPGGGTAQTPVGTVFLGLAGKDGIIVQECHFTGDRQAIRRKATKAALTMILADFKRRT